MLKIEDFPELNGLIEKTIKKMQIRENRLFFFGNTQQDIKIILTTPMEYIDKLKDLYEKKIILALKYYYVDCIRQTLMRGDDGIFKYLENWLLLGVEKMKEIEND